MHVSNFSYPFARRGDRGGEEAGRHAATAPARGDVGADHADMVEEVRAGRERLQALEADDDPV
jgi:hypothetical protein